MSKIDNRIVNLRLENEKFNSNAKSSESALKKLEEALKLNNASSGLNKIQDTASKINLSPVEKGAAQMGKAFDAAKVVAITALVKITEKALEVGKNLVNTFFIQPRMDGFKEYEDKMKAIQTIMNSTGEKLPTVKKYLEDLNKYADDTIYSFKDMTSNVSKFTNAGVKLDKATAAIKGVSNVAALSGANAEQASHAMYNFAQALSTGHVKLIDWKSIETANMATVEFKQELLKTAVAMGKVKKTADGMYQVMSANGKGKYMEETMNAQKNFNDSLQYRWMTNEVLTATLNRYADASTELGKKAFAAARDIKTFTQWIDVLKESAGSGWAMTFEYIIGDFEEAKKLWTDLDNVIGLGLQQSHEARNKILKEWHDLGGRTELLKALSNIFGEIGKVLDAIKGAFVEVFPPTTGKQVYEATVKFREFTEKIKIGDETLKRIKETFKLFFNILSGGKAIMGAAFGILKTTLSTFGGFIPIILNLIGRFSELINKIIKSIQQTKLFQTAFGFLKDTFKTVNDVIKIFIEAFGALLDYFITFDKKKLFESFEKITAKFPGIANQFKTSFENIGKYLKISEKDFERFRNVIDRIGEAIKTGIEFILLLVDKLTGAFSTDNVQMDYSMLEEISSNVDKYLVKPLKFVYDKIKIIVKKLKEILKDFIDKLPEHVNFDNLNKALFVSILFHISKFFKELTKMTNNTSKLVESIKQIGDAIRDTFGAIQKTLKAEAIKKIATAIAILVASVIALALIDKEKLTYATGSLTILSAVLYKFYKEFMKLNEDSKVDATKAAKNIERIAISLLILSQAVKILGELKIEDAIQGVVLVGILLTELTIAINKFPPADKTIGKVGGIIAFAVAITILSKAVEILSKIEFLPAIGGLALLGGILTEMGIFLKLVEVNSMSLSSGAGFVLFATSLTMLVGVLKLLSMFKPEDAGKALLILGILLVELGVFSSAVGKVNPKNMLAMGASLMALSGALTLLIPFLITLSFISWETIKKAGFVLGGFIASISIAAALLPVNKIPVLIALAGALTLLAVGVDLFVPALIALSVVPMDAIGNAMFLLATVFGGFVVAATMLGPVAPMLLALGASMIMLSGSIALLGVGLVAISVGLTALGMVGTAAFNTLWEMIKMISAGIAVLLDGVIKALEKNLGPIVKLIFDFIKKIGQEFLNALPGILSNLGKMLEIVFKFLLENIPKFIQKGADFIIALIKGILSKIGDLIAAIVELILAILNAIKDHLGDIIVAGIGIIVSLIDGLARGIEENGPKLRVALGRLIMAILNFLKDGAVDIIKGFAEGIWGAIIWAKNAIGDFVNGIIDKFKSMLGINSPSKVFMEFGKFIIEGLINGINNLKDAALKVMGNIRQWLEDKWKGAQEWFQQTGQNLMNGLKGGIEFVKGTVSSAMDGVKTALMNVWNGIRDAFSGIGQQIGGGLENGINSSRSGAVSASRATRDGVTKEFDGMNSTFERIGRNVGEGFSSGIRNSAWQSQREAENMARKVIHKSGTTLEVHSPSKVFERIGGYVSQGFAIGIRKSAELAVRAVNSMTDNVIDSSDENVDLFKENLLSFMNEDLDLNPKISPVLDLSKWDSSLLNFEDPKITPTLQLAAITPTNNTKPEEIVNNEYNDYINNFYVTATIREEADIQKVSEKLYEMQDLENRRRGI